MQLLRERPQAGAQRDDLEEPSPAPVVVEGDRDRLELHVGFREPGGLQVALCVGFVLVFPADVQCGGLVDEGRLGEHFAGGLVHALEVAFSSERSEQPSPGPEHTVELPVRLRVVADPVQDGVRDHEVERAVHRQGSDVAFQDLYPSPVPFECPFGLLHHAGVDVHGDDAHLLVTLQDLVRQPTRAAPGVEHPFVPLPVVRADQLEAPSQLHARHVMVGGGVPGGALCHKRGIARTGIIPEVGCGRRRGFRRVVRPRATFNNDEGLSPSWMRGMKGVLLLMAVGLMLGPSAAGLDEPIAQGGLGEAALDVAVEPSADSVQEAGSLVLDVHVVGSLYCSPGLPPAPILGMLVPEESPDGLDLVFQPEEIRLDWEPSGNAGEVEHRVNSTLQVMVGVMSAPFEPVVTQFHVFFSPEGGRDGSGCTAQGYQVTQSENPGPAVTVEPGQESAQDDGIKQGSFNWFPLVLAVALLGVVSLFAVQRDQRRRGK